MMLDSTSTVLALALLALTNAQMVGEIGDGQIQNQAPSAVPIIQPASASEVASVTAPPPAETPSPTPSPLESAAALSAAPSNATSPPLESPAPKEIPASLAGPRVPLYTANSTMASMATGTGGVGVGVNASAPTVPAVPTGAGMAPSEKGGVKEAGTSAPAVVGGTGKGRGGGVMGLVWVWVCLGWAVGVMGVMG